MVTAAPPATVQAMSLQGIVVPAASVNPAAFFEQTNRLTTKQANPAWPGFGSSTPPVSILQTGILSQIQIRFSGVLTVTLAGGTAATTAAWPYNLLKKVRFAANGQSQLINISGWMLKARQFMERGDTQDRGVARGVGGASPGTARTQGTLSLANEDWGVGSNVTAIPGAPTQYPVELQWIVPVSYDQLYLNGAIFAQTSSTDLNVGLDTANQNELFTLTGAATAVLTGGFVLEATVFTIPQGPSGEIIVPDLSSFHSLIQTDVGVSATGEQEYKLAGQGVGRQLLRIYYQIRNGATPAPLPMTATNYGPQAWRFGTNNTPEVFADGRDLAQRNENMFGVDFASLQGIGIFDWASEHAFRDSIDEGTATELRLVSTVQSGVTLTNALLSYVQETMIAGGVGA
jgi:hypothetical protein